MGVWLSEVPPSQLISSSSLAAARLLCVHYETAFLRQINDSLTPITFVKFYLMTMKEGPDDLQSVSLHCNPPVVQTGYKAAASAA